MDMMSKDLPLPKGAWLVVALLFVIGLLNYLDRIMLTTMRSSIIAAMPMTDAQFGLLTSAFLWTYGLLSPFAGFMADKFNRSRVIVASLFVWSFVTWMTAYAGTFESLLLTRVLMGVSEACYIPAALALIADYHRSSTRSLATGIHMAGIMVGSSLGFLGGLIAERHTWNHAFMLFGVIGTAYAGVVLLLLRDPPRDKELAGGQDHPQPSHEDGVRLTTGLAELFSNKSFLVMLCYWGLLGIVGWLVVGWLPTFYKERFNLSQAAAGLYATGCLYPVSIVGLLLGGFAADRWSGTNRLARLHVPALGLCLAAPCIFLASSMSALPLAIAFFMVYALTKAFCDTNMMPMLCMVVNPRYRATGYGVINALGTIVGGVALYAGGALRDMNIELGQMYQAAALIMLVCASLLFMIRPKTAPGGA